MVVYRKRNRTENLLCPGSFNAAWDVGKKQCEKHRWEASLAGTKLVKPGCWDMGGELVLTILEFVSKVLNHSIVNAKARKSAQFTLLSQTMRS